MNYQAGNLRDQVYVEAPPASRGALPGVARAQLKMTLALWGANFVAFTLANILAGSHRLVAAGTIRLVTFGFGMALCYGMHRLLRSLARKPFRTRAIVLGFTALVAAETHAWFIYFAFAGLNHSEMRFHIADWNNAILSLAMWTWFFIAWAGLYMGIEYSAEVLEEERRSSELRDLAHSAKLRALHNQINPHFLFNSINSVSALIIEGRGAEAERLLVRLSTIFRQTLATDPTTDIPLGEEVDLQLAYLSIEQTRYPDLEVSMDVPEDLRAALVPALLLQPVVENAIKHGVGRSGPPTSIAIGAQTKGDLLEITVENAGRPHANAGRPAGRGIGLRNVRERLQERFGDRQSFVAGPHGPNGWRVRLAFPLNLPDQPACSPSSR